MPRLLLVLSCMLFVWLGAAMAWAQEAEPVPDEAVVARARELHRQGVALLESGDAERALGYFRQSRNVYPSSQNIANEAICLDQLGRYDEALEVYETLLTGYVSGLSAADRATLYRVMVSLRAKVGSIWVSASVDGATLIVDGRVRATLPQADAVRVVAGVRAVRVLKPGYETFEAKVDVIAGKEVIVDAKLGLLREVGRLRVEDADGLAATVFVDGAEVGETPWEGPLRPGAHVVWTRRAELGSNLIAAAVVEGQLALVRAPAEPLGPPLRLRTEPRSASIKLDGISVGVGDWEGRLPVGAHTAVVFEPGYHTRTEPLSSVAGALPAEVTLALEIDRDHPRWPRPHVVAAPEPEERGELRLEAFGGYAGTGTLGSDAEADCPSRCSGDPSAHGFMAGARGGYHFPFGLTLELSGGYLWLSSSIQRSASGTFGQDDEFGVHYELSDLIRVRGPFVAPGASYEHLIGGPVHLVARLSVGAFFSAASDDIEGTATAGASQAPILVGDGETARQVTLFVQPAVGATLQLGSFRAGLELGVAFFPLAGPTLSNQHLRSAAGVDPGDPGAVGNARASQSLADERAYRGFALWLPQLSVGHAF